MKQLRKQNLEGYTRAREIIDRLFTPEHFPIVSQRNLEKGEVYTTCENIYVLVNKKTGQKTRYRLVAKDFTCTCGCKITGEAETIVRVEPEYNIILLWRNDKIWGSKNNKRDGGERQVHPEFWNLVDGAINEDFRIGFNL
ncbi:MAG: hypothetical protein KJ559_01500 [Nanoarchaeota archaeon]|nr:hypothetical protein [Nanoarchaeota archaeon]